MRSFVFSIPLWCVSANNNKSQRVFLPGLGHGVEIENGRDNSDIWSYGERKKTLLMFDQAYSFWRILFVAPDV